MSWLSYIIHFNWTKETRFIQVVVVVVAIAVLVSLLHCKQNGSAVGEKFNLSVCHQAPSLETDMTSSILRTE